MCHSRQVVVGALIPRGGSAARGQRGARRRAGPPAPPICCPRAPANKRRPASLLTRSGCRKQSASILSDDADADLSLSAARTPAAGCDKSVEGAGALWSGGRQARPRGGGGSGGGGSRLLRASLVRRARPARAEHCLPLCPLQPLQKARTRHECAQLLRHLSGRRGAQRAQHAKRGGARLDVAATQLLRRGLERGGDVWRGRRGAASRGASGC